MGPIAPLNCVDDFANANYSSLCTFTYFDLYKKAKNTVSLLSMFLGTEFVESVQHNNWVRNKYFF